MFYLNKYSGVAAGTNKTQVLLSQLPIYICTNSANNPFQMTRTHTPENLVDLGRPILAKINLERPEWGIEKSV